MPQSGIEVLQRFDSDILAALHFIEISGLRIIESAVLEKYDRDRLGYKLDECRIRCYGLVDALALSTLQNYMPYYCCS